jgi:hypothetical protein
MLLRRVIFAVLKCTIVAINHHLDGKRERDVFNSLLLVRKYQNTPA